MGEDSMEAGRTGYRFDFYRTILNASGTPFRCSVGSVQIRRARSRERALAAAMRRLERKHDVRAWDRVADGWTSEDLPEDATRQH